jgi:hypothetical protein
LTPPKRPKSRGHAGGARLPTHPAERDRSSVLAVVRAHALDLAGRDPHDVDGIADHVSGAALASGTLSHRTTSSRNLLK